MTDPNATPSTPDEQAAAAAAAEVPAAPAAPAAEVPAAPAAPAAPEYVAPAATAAPGYTAPAAPAAPGQYAPAGGYAPAAPVKQTLSLIGFIAGLAGLLFALFGGWGLLFSIAAVVLSMMGKKRELQAPKWMWLTGIITGWVGIALNLIIGGIVLFLTVLPLIIFGSMGSYGY